MPQRTRKSLEDRLVSRIKRQLVQKGMIVKIGYGVYSRATVSPISGKIRPDGNLINLAGEVLSRLKIPTAPSSALRAYNEGRSTQVPTGRMIGVKGRIARKIGFDGMNITFERIV
jgi:hypothetical protein